MSSSVISVHVSMIYIGDMYVLQLRNEDLTRMGSIGACMGGGEEYEIMIHTPSPPLNHSTLLEKNEMKLGN